VVDLILLYAEALWRVELKLKSVPVRRLDVGVDPFIDGEHASSLGGRYR